MRTGRKCRVLLLRGHTPYHAVCEAGFDQMTVA